MTFRRKFVSVLVLILLFGLVFVSSNGANATEAPALPGTGVFTVNTYTSSPGLAIADSPTISCNTTPSPVTTDTINVPDSGTVTDLNLVLDITHPWVGDLQIILTSPAGTSVTVVELIGNVNPPAATGCGCSGDNITTTLNDESAGGPVESACPPTGPDYTPHSALSAFDGENISGVWTLDIYDWTFDDTGTLNSWSLVFDYTPTPSTVVSDAYQKIGQIQVNAPGTALYQEPGGDPVRNAAGSEIWVPNQTAPDPSQDVYDVISQVEVDGQVWVSIFVGNSLRPAWVPIGGPVQVLSLAQ